jgi:glycosyltransferase involved in cell wall biosynthesis
MRILFLASVFPPKIIGGAELSAYEQAKWLADRGHQIGVLTVAQSRSEELHGEFVDGLQIWKLKLPRLHTQHEHRAKPRMRKLLWHLQDHLDPRNRLVVESVARQFQPDVVNVHVMQGLGHNALAAFAGGTIPVFYFLHDLTLACFRTGMYRRGQNCAGQCLPCKASSFIKLHAIRRIPNFHLISPSRANLDVLNQLVGTNDIPGAVLPNLDSSPCCSHQPRIPGTPPRLIYAGRLDETKGIDWIMTVLDDLSEGGCRFQMKVVGGGPLEDRLRSTYQSRPWVTFTGQIPSEEVSGHLTNSDMLLLPSLWRENHPGIVRQALRSGIPVVVSDLGGSKEMVTDGESGVVLRAGDRLAWSAAITDLLTRPGRLESLQAGASRAGESYSADTLGEKFQHMLQAAVEVSRAKTKFTAAPVKSAVV